MTTDTKIRPVATATRAAVRDLLELHDGEFESLLSKYLREIKNGGDVGEEATSNNRRSTDAEPAKRRGSRKSHADTEVLDSKGRILKKDMKVETPDGGTGIVTRFNRSQGRVVVQRENGQLRMVTGHRVTIAR